MKILQSDALRRTALGAVAGFALTFGVVALASADAYIDENGVPVASSGDTTVSIVGGESVILYGSDGAAQIDALSASAEAEEVSLGDDSGTSVSDASGGEYNIGVVDK